MIYLLWSILNLVILVWFLLAAFSVLKQVLKTMGMVSAIIFVAAIFSFAKGMVMNPNGACERSLDEKKVVETTTVEHLLFFNLDLTYSYLKDTTERSEILGNISQSGIVIGHDWNPSLTELHRADDVIHYKIAGEHQWKLLGLALYSEPKEFTGTIKTK